MADIWKFVPLRKKILLYFSIILTVVGVISAVSYYYMNRTLDDFNGVYANLKILEDYRTSIREISSDLNKYLSENDRTYISSFYRKYNVLQDGLNTTRLKFMKRNDNLQFENIKNMIGTYGEEADAALTEYRKRNIEESADKLAHTLKIQSYVEQNINELTLSYVSQSKVFQEKLLKQLLILRTLVLSMIIMSLALCVFLGAYFRKSFVKPIDALVAMANRISSGDFQVERIARGSYNELQTLAETMYRMSRQLKGHIEKIEENAEVQKLLHEKEMENLKINTLLKETELKRLQAQVNPHFLFNTLATLHHTAFLENADQTCEIAEAISGILRYNLRGADDSVSLRDEVDNLKYYFFIQEKRYGHRVSVFYYINEGILDFPIPKMTVQPIVENAFIHGVENNEGHGRIEVSVYKEQDSVVVKVADNGPGIEENELNRIKEGLDPEACRGHTSGIGINNVVNRLRAFYSRENVISIQSVKGVGTVVKLILPCSFSNKNCGRDVFEGVG